MTASALWPFQADVVRAARAALRHHKSIGIVSPTGSGKTRIAGEIIQQIYRQLGDKRGGVGLFLVHRKELITQTQNTLDRLGLGDAYGVIQSGRAGTPWAPLQIGSIPTMVRRLHQMEWLEPRVIFIDEGHHATAATWEKVIARWPKAYKIFLTATPARLDDKGLGNLIDHLVIGPQIRELVPECSSPRRGSFRCRRPST